MQESGAGTWRDLSILWHGLSLWGYDLLLHSAMQIGPPQESAVSRQTSSLEEPCTCFH